MDSSDRRIASASSCVVASEYSVLSPETKFSSNAKCSSFGVVGYYSDNRLLIITASKHLVNVDKVVSTRSQAIDTSHRGIALLLVGFLPEVAHLPLLGINCLDHMLLKQPTSL